MKGIIQIACIFFVLVSACRLDIDRENRGPQKTGSVVFQFSTGPDGSRIARQHSLSGGARTVFPAASDLEIATVRIERTDPDNNTHGASITLTQDQTSIQLTELEPVEWDFILTAKNGSGLNIARGSTTVTVEPDQTITEPITLTPVSGDGTLDIHVSWPASVTAPQLTADITDRSDQTVTPVDFGTLSGTVEDQLETLPAGSYTITIELQEDGKTLATIFEEVHIYAELTSELSYDLTEGMINASPKAPTNLRTSAVSDTSATLQWDDNSLTEHGFTLERKASTGDFSPIASSLAPGTTSYTDDSIDLSTVDYYTYRVFAYNDDFGASDYSEEFSVLYLPVETNRIAAGAEHSFYIDQSNTLYASGYNNNGQLGTGDLTGRELFTEVLEDVSYVSTGQHHTLAVKSDGTLWAAGDNQYGQLGTGGTTDQLSFTQVLSDVVCAEAGQYHSTILKNDGSVWTCGHNSLGQLGTGDTDIRYEPTLVFSGCKKIDVGRRFTLVLTAEGKVYGTGRSYEGQLTTYSDRSSFYSMSDWSGITDISAGKDFSMILDSGNSVWVVGNNTVGQLGLGPFGPDKTSSLNGLSMFDGYTVLDIGGLSSHAYVITQSSDTVWFTGNNSNGQLGDGTTGNSFTSYSSSLTNVQTAAGGWYHTLVLTNDNRLYGAGSDLRGQLSLVGESGDVTPFQEVVLVPDIRLLNEGTSISPSSTLELNTVSIGSSEVVTITIQNNGIKQLTLNGTPTVTITDGTHFSVDTQPGTTDIEGGGQTTFSVRYQPASLGTHTDTVTITSNDTDNPTFSFDIQGTATAAITKHPINNEHDTNLDELSEITVEDFDNDGDQDIMAIGDSHVWFENGGAGGSFTEHAISSVSDPSCFSVGDIDDDGWIDVVVGSSAQDRLGFMYNNGDGTFSSFDELEVSYLDLMEDDQHFYDVTSVLIADIEGTATAEILATTGSAYDYYHLYWGEDNGGFDKKIDGNDRIIGYASPGYGILSSTDIDGDGDVDLLGSGAPGPELDKFTLWIGWGSGSFSLGYRGDMTRINSAVAADFDGDGDMDIAAASYDLEISWWENDGAENFTKTIIESSSTGGSGQYSPLCTADMDNDGDMDLLSAENADYFKIIWWSNNGDGTFVRYMFDEQSYQCVFPADIDGDGDIDVVVGERGSGPVHDDSLLFWWEMEYEP